MRKGPLALALVCLSMVGCGGDKLATVEGTVTFDGRPLRDATIVFSPRNGARPSTAKTDENGHYRLLFTPKQAGAEVGQHTVSISDIPQDSDTREVRAARVKIPARYNVESTLAVEVQPRANTFDFDLTSKAK